MRGKKGMFLASEVLKMVLAVISIGLLVYLLAALYFSNEDTKNLAKAEASIEIISGVVERLEADSGFRARMDAVNPHAWSVFSFVEGLKPNQCAGQSCLCICDSVYEEFWFYTSKERQEKECSKDGTCLVVENLRDFGEIELGSASEPVSLRFFIEEGFVEVEKI